MMRLNSSGPGVVRYALGVASCACAIAAAFSMTGRAGQLRSVTEGVYSGGQAARGQQIYQVQCAECHGKAMEGTIGPPLVGESFLSNWSARPLGALVDKIQKTMPFNLPGSLSRQQSTDLAAYMLQAGKFPAGQAERGDAMLAQIALPTARTSPVSATGAATAGGTSLPPPEGNLAELMRAIAFPNSNIIFKLQSGSAPSRKRSDLRTVRHSDWGHGVWGMAGVKGGRGDHRDSALS
jgi:mono/diheme cytochrome c family protein